MRLAYHEDLNLGSSGSFPVASGELCARLFATLDFFFSWRFADAIGRLLPRQGWYTRMTLRTIHA